MAKCGCKKFGMGGSATVTRGGESMINKQETRRGSTLGYQKSMPNINLNKYEGKKAGGTVKHDDILEDKKLIKKAIGMHDKQEHKGKHTDLSKLKKGGKCMAKGGLSMDPEIEAGERHLAHGEHADQKRGHTRGTEVKMAKGGKTKCMATGGYVRSADGIASRGKTKGKIC